MGTAVLADRARDRAVVRDRSWQDEVVTIAERAQQRLRRRRRTEVTDDAPVEYLCPPVHLSTGIRPKRRDDVVRTVEGALLPGEHPVAVFAINRVRRSADLLAVTSHRLLTWSRLGSLYTLVDDIDGAAANPALAARVTPLRT